MNAGDEHQIDERIQQKSRWWRSNWWKNKTKTQIMRIYQKKVLKKIPIWWKKWKWNPDDKGIPEKQVLHVSSSKLMCFQPHHCPCCHNWLLHLQAETQEFTYMWFIVEIGQYIMYEWGNTLKKQDIIHT